MNEREVAEIRRRFRADKSNITHIRGCYVNDKKEILARFSQPLTLLSQTENEEILTILKKTLSGTLGKNLIDINFVTRQVVQSDEHRLLMTLRDSALRDDAAVETFYQRVIDALQLEGNYMILLTCDSYDIPYRAKDDEDMPDAAAEVYRYILCSICPVKMTKPALSYYVHENAFRNLSPDWVISAPELGFLFPAFDDRSTNLYGALYYTRDITEGHKAFTDTVFHSELPLPAAVQKETFQTLLGSTLEQQCSYDVVQSVHSQLCGLITEHKENKVREPLELSGSDVCQVLESCDVERKQLDAFRQRYNESFGADAALRPKNIIDTKQVEVKTADVTIRVSPERGDLVETRVIDGVRYILIRAEDGVEVNGVNIHIS